MTDKIILYPLINKSDFLYKEYNLLPNDITLINNLIVTPLTLYFLYKKKLKLSFVFLYMRAYLDGVDGYIARKYKKGTKLGEIYDHVSDSIYSGFISLFVLDNITDNEIKYPISYIVSIIIMVCNFNKKYKYIGEKIMGAGGNSETYSTIINMLPCLLILKNKSSSTKYADKEIIRNVYTIFPSMFIRKKNKLLDFKNE